MAMRDNPAIAGVILAAGQGRRYRPGQSPENSNKLLADLDGEPLIRRTVRAAIDSRLTPILVVTGPQADDIRAVLGEFDVEILANPNADDGQSTSVRVAVEVLDSTERTPVAGALFLPADQPLVGSRLLDRLVEGHRSHGGIVVTTWNDKPRAPVLFDRLFFAELATLRGDVGGRRLLPRHADAVYKVEAEAEAEVLDVDTFDDLRRLRRCVDKSTHRKRHDSC